MAGHPCMAAGRRVMKSFLVGAVLIALPIALFVLSPVALLVVIAGIVFSMGAFIVGDMARDIWQEIR